MATFIGTPGNDTLIGGAGDIVEGDSGDDHIQITAGATARGGDGVDHLTLGLANETNAINFRVTDQIVSDYTVMPGGVTAGGNFLPDTVISGFEHFEVMFGSGDDRLDLSGATLSDTYFHFGSYSFSASSFEGNGGYDAIVIDADTRGSAYISSFERLEADLSAVTTDIEYKYDGFYHEYRLVFEGFLLSINESSPFTSLVITGGSGNDRFVGGAGADILIGGAGDDYISGSAGDVLEGGEGNDTIHGTTGAIMRGGDGDDHLFLQPHEVTESINFRIADQMLSDYEIVPGTVISGFESFMLSFGSADVTIDASGAALSYRTSYFFGGEGTSTLILDEQTRGDVLASNFDRLEADLSAMTTDIVAESRGLSFEGFRLSTYSGDWFTSLVITGGSGDDTLSGGAGADILIGGAGDDEISGGAGGDTLRGGTGNDSLDGGEGSDTYLFGTGWGQDTIHNANPTGTDAVVFDAGIAAADIIVHRKGDDLILAHTNGADKITVSSYFHSAQYRIDEVRFNDGSVWNTTTLAALANLAPAITSPSAFSIAENKTAVATIKATDPEKTKLTYSIAGGADKALFVIDSNTGALSFKAAPDFEAPKDNGKNNVYDVTVKVMDAGGLTATQALKVTVTNVNEAPVITSNGGGSSATINVAENRTAVTTVKASDPEKSALAYSISGGADKALFTINSKTGALSFKSAPDFETPKDNGKNNVYDVIVKVTDAGKLTDTQTIKISVTDVKGKTINGTAKADKLTGTLEADTLNGGAGNDVLKGGAGDDRLYGGAGNDKLYGEAGKDTFIFKSVKELGTSKTATDTIFDFDGKGGDRIDLSGIDAKVSTTKDDAFAFIDTKAFSKKAGELRYEKTKSDTYIYGDTNGDGAADFVIHLNDPLALSKGYFVL